MMLMRKSAVAVLMTCLASSVQGSDMLGDTLTFNRAWPTPTTPYWPVPQQTTTVTADSSDLIDWYSSGNSGFHLAIDPGATTLDFTLFTASSFIGHGAQFDGFRVVGFGQPIAWAGVIANDSGLGVAVSFAGAALDIDLLGGNVGGQTGFVIGVSLVPEPATWLLWLAGASALGAGAARRRRRTAG